jgi:CRISPR-associated protein Cas5a/b/c
MPQLRAFYAKVLTTWGFVVRHRGVSAAQPAYPVPLPTTIVGAFGYPLIRMLKLPLGRAGGIEWGEGNLVTEVMKPLLEATITASGGLTSPRYEASSRTHTSILWFGLAVHQEPGRINAVPFKGGGDLERIRRAKFASTDFFIEAVPRALPVQAVGAAYAPRLKLELLWVVDVERLSKELGISVERLDSAAQKAIYGVVRVGSKEGLVALEDAKYTTEVKIHRPGENVHSRLYVSKACAELQAGSAGELVMPDLRYRLSYFYLPAQVASNNLVIPLPEEYPAPVFKVLSPCVAYSIDTGIASMGAQHER